MRHWETEKTPGHGASELSGNTLIVGGDSVRDISNGTDKERRDGKKSTNNYVFATPFIISLKMLSMFDTCVHRC
jgi:hypothetical protein